MRRERENEGRGGRKEKNVWQCVLYVCLGGHFTAGLFRGRGSPYGHCQSLGWKRQDESEGKGGRRVFDLHCSTVCDTCLDLLLLNVLDFNLVSQMLHKDYFNQ